MTSYAAIDDQELLLLVAQGNEQAFDALYHRYSKRVYRFALRVLRSEMLAEEVMQETMLKVWRLARETRIANLEAYLRTIARRASLNLLRRQEIERRAEVSLAVDWDESEYNTEEQVLLNDAKRMLAEAVQLLPPQQRTVFQLCHQQGLTYEEAAAKMKRSPQTVAVHMKLALRFIRHYLQKATDLLAILVVLRLF